MRSFFSCTEFVLSLGRHLLLYSLTSDGYSISKWLFGLREVAPFSAVMSSKGIRTWVFMLNGISEIFQHKIFTVTCPLEQANTTTTSLYDVLHKWLLTYLCVLGEMASDSCYSSPSMGSQCAAPDPTPLGKWCWRRSTPAAYRRPGFCGQ